MNTSNQYIKTWQCPYCNGFATIRNGDLLIREEQLLIYPDANLSYTLTAITCPNSNCRKLNLHLIVKDNTPIPPMAPLTHPSGQLSPGLKSELEEKRRRKRMDFSWRLLPSSKAKNFPDFVPQTIRDDYEEACKIVDLSPKSSATLARRCLQTIIRDFWNIKNKDTLNQEIDALLQRTDLNSGMIGAFHDLRNIGNIGAHMEKDASLIIDVEPEEAEELIKFIESLIGLTYVEKHSHDELLKKIKNISADKKEKQNKK